MRLRELDGRLIKRKINGSVNYRIPVDSIADADGVQFLCPKCYEQNKGREGTHSVICWFVGRVPDDLDPKPGRWNPSGSTIEDLTFVAPGPVSVLIPAPGCRWHGHVINGEATLS